MPPGAVKVDRSTVFGNPWSVSPIMTQAQAVAEHGLWIAGSLSDADLIDRYGSLEGEELVRRRRIVCERLSELRGKDLACWCAPGAPCHVDTLLRLANA
jgi:hypothetical protein